jgi:Xaa-Pro aminopeptidase
MRSILTQQLAAIQAALREEGLDGWLLYDAHGLNPIARQIVGIAGVVTRRWFALIPADGEPRFLFHRIESLAFDPMPGVKKVYRTWQELDEGIDWILQGCRRVAMEYSPDNALPDVARVDAATIDKIRARKAEVVSSADLIAQFLATWTAAQIESHNRAAKALIEIKDQAFALIARKVRERSSLTEHDVTAYIREEFARRGMVNHDEGPICAVDTNAGNPHYEPTAQKCAAIGPNQLVLLDLWAKFDEPDAVYADITWTGYTGAAIPIEIAKVFSIVAQGRDRAVAFANEAFARGDVVHGFEVDRAVRKIITDAGYGDFFIHRTGHSLGRTVHDVGPNIDDLETQDRRRLQDGVAFTVEPGIYLPHFGIRSEINVLIRNRRAIVTTLPLQTEVVCLV